MNRPRLFFIFALLALLSTTYVSSGTARFVHQWTEHRHVDSQGVVSWSDDDDAPPPVKHPSTPDQTEHHVCPTCLLLNGMGKAGLAPPIILTSTFAFDRCAEPLPAYTIHFAPAHLLISSSPRAPPTSL